jgi:hypothetical protein
VSGAQVAGTADGCEVGVGRPLLTTTVPGGAVDGATAGPTVDPTVDPAVGTVQQ